MLNGSTTISSVFGQFVNRMTMSDLCRTDNDDFTLKMKKIKLALVPYIFILSTWEVDLSESEVSLIVPGQPELHA